MTRKILVYTGDGGDHKIKQVEIRFCS